nr:Na-translocating system protein MpsC family protein [Sinobaca sp. H24]
MNNEYTICSDSARKLYRKTVKGSFRQRTGLCFRIREKAIYYHLLKRFITPVEQVLINQDKQTNVEKTRDYLMEELIPEIKEYLSENAGFSIEEVYYDWSLDTKSGMILGVLSEGKASKENTWEMYPGKEKIHKEIIRMSRHAEKTPVYVDSFYLNERTLVIMRTGILVRIEKELIKAGFEEELKITKRPLEKNLIRKTQLEETLPSAIENIFLDWDFAEDISFIVIILNPNK